MSEDEYRAAFEDLKRKLDRLPDTGDWLLGVVVFFIALVVAFTVML